MIDVQKIKFCHKNDIYEDNYVLDRNMGDIFIEYLSSKNLDINKVCFKYKEN